MWLAWVQDYLSHTLCAAELNIDLLKQFSEMFDGFGNFAFGLTSRHVHNDWNALQVLDNQILEQIKYYKEEGNTMFILFGDHGSRAGGLRESLQGKLEERLPFLSITLPSSFKRSYPKFYNAMKYNSELLTTYFDVHATFRHILTYPSLPDTSVRGQSLFTKLPLNRTCASEGIEEHWCTCMAYKDVAISKPIVQKVALEMVKFMNSLVSQLNETKEICAAMKLERVFQAGVHLPNKKLQQFKNTKRDDVCDSCGVILDDKINADEADIKNYQLILTVLPSHGKFEINAKVDSEGVITVDPLISRINMYRDQPKCIATKYPHLRPFCYCLKNI